MNRLALFLSLLVSLLVPNVALAQDMTAVYPANGPTETIFNAEPTSTTRYYGPRDFAGYSGALVQVTLIASQTSQCTSVQVTAYPGYITAQLGDMPSPIARRTAFPGAINTFYMPNLSGTISFEALVTPAAPPKACAFSVSVTPFALPGAVHKADNDGLAINTLDGAPADTSRVTLEADVAQRVTTTAGSSVRVHCTAKSYYSVGTTSVTATTADVPLPEEAVEKFKLGAAQTSISFISSTAGAICSVSKLGAP